MTARYVLNVNPGGTDTLHRNPREECNTDDATEAEVIDSRTALAMMSKGEARPCMHCMGVGSDYRPTLDVQNHIGDA